MKRKSYFRTCPNCRAYLDPGELCDCRQKESRPGAANTRGGEGGKATAEQLIPASILGYTGGGCQG